MLALRSQGIPLKAIVKDFVREYGVSPQALYEDWRNRMEWADEVARVGDPTLIDEMVEGLRQVIPNAWYEYKTSPNPSVKLGALKLVKETYLNLIEVVQSLGSTHQKSAVREIRLKWLNE
jgi:hypothetical protein